MKKRIFLIFLVSLLVFASCAKGGDEPVDTQDTLSAVEWEPLDEDAVSRVCAVWEDFLEAAEIKTQTEAWALAYLKAYCEEPSVIGLQRAISAAETAVATLSEIKLPECDLSAETLKTLADSGVDMSFVPIEYETLGRTIEDGEKVWNSMLHSLLTESFWEYGIEYIDGWADVRLESEAVYTSFRGKMTNAVALSLRESEGGLTWVTWQNNAPHVLTEDFVWTDDEDLLTSEMSSLLDRLEELTVESAELNGVLGANYAMFEKAADTGDWSEVNSVAVDLEDHFVPIPLPEWSAACIYSYKYDEATDSVQWTSVGDDLTICPDGFIFQYDGITLDEFNYYVDFLATLGVKYYENGSTAEGESISLIYLDYCTMSLKWNGGLASIYFYDNEPLLVPSWYIGYMLSSLN